MMMMPLTFAKAGAENTVIKIGGRSDTKKFLENLGFVSGTIVSVISESAGNLIVDIRGSRIAIGKDMANKIMVQQNII